MMRNGYDAAVSNDKFANFWLDSDLNSLDAEYAKHKLYYITHQCKYIVF